MNQLRVRYSPTNIPSFYTSTGALVTNIKAISYDGSDDVFTVSERTGVYLVRDPNRGMYLAKLEDVVGKYIVYLVA